jgi:hypothetical protein
LTQNEEQGVEKAEDAIEAMSKMIEKAKVVTSHMPGTAENLVDDAERGKMAANAQMDEVRTYASQVPCNNVKLGGAIRLVKGSQRRVKGCLVEIYRRFLSRASKNIKTMVKDAEKLQKDNRDLMKHVQEIKKCAADIEAYVKAPKIDEMGVKEVERLVGKAESEFREMKRVAAEKQEKLTERN